MPRKVSDADFDNAVQRYLSGELTQKEAGAVVGLSQPSFSSRLRRNGYATISRGEAMSRRLGRMSRAERTELASAAHKAARGRIHSEEERGKVARTKQERQSHATDEERRLAAMLSDVNPVLQQAVGRYNLDLGIAPVAVEIMGGGWHAYGEHLARLEKRTMHLADAGWNLLFVWTHRVHPMDLAAVANDVRAYHQLTSSDPAIRRQYRMIWGDGQFIASGGLDDRDRSLVPTGIRDAYAATW